MTWLPPGAGDITSATLVALAVVSMLRGWILPRSYLTDVRNDREIRLAEMREERDEWRKAFEAAAAQNRVLLENSETSLALLRSLHRAAEEKA